MTDQYFVSSPGILGLRSNVPGLKWSWGVNMPAVGFELYEQCRVKVRLIVGDVEPCQPDRGTGDLGKYHYFSGREDGDCIYYERTLLGKRTLKLRIDGLLGDEPTLTVNREYFRYITHRFMNLHSAGYVMTDLVSLLLLRHHLTPLHCAGFRHDGATVLVLAPPNTGKTLTSMLACIEHGSEFLAEDLAISDGKSIYSVPWTSTFRYYGEIQAGRTSRVVNALQRRVPPLELLPLSKAKPVDHFVAPNMVLDESVITHVAILERGDEGVYAVDTDIAVRKAVNLNRYEFNYVKSPALVAYEFFNPTLDLDAAAAEERRLLRAVVECAAETVVVRTRDATRYAPLILDHLSGR